MKGKLLVLLPATGVNLIATSDELLKDLAILLTDSINEISVRVCDVHVPRTAAVPVEEVNRLVELFLRAGKSGFQVTAKTECRQVPVPLAACVEVERPVAIGELLITVHHEALRVGQFENLCKERVAPSLHAERVLHLFGVMKLVVGVLHIMTVRR